MDEVSDTIHDQKKILKEEMVQVIDKKLDDKIKVQLQEINDLQATINKLKQGNNQVRGVSQKVWPRGWVDRMHGSAIILLERSILPNNFLISQK